jgi:AcrR family transcriptional regulator
MAQPLSRERILEAALDILDREGLEALSMRRLGDALGVEAMSLYNHVPNKAALLDGIQERILGLVEASPETRDWRAFARHQGVALHRALCAHPNAVTLFARPAGTTAVFSRLDTYLGVLRHAGFAPLDALYVVQIVLSFVVGHAMWTVGAADPSRAAPAGKKVEETARHLHLYDPEDELEMGLEALLRGLRPKRGRSRS